jgi:biotin-(acetyl-CoA carboxylase) ligase
VTGRDYERGPILAHLLAELESRYDLWCAHGLEGVYDDLGARDFLRGRRVAVGDVQGVAQMIARDGRLLVDTDAGAVHVESGEVAYRG